MKGARDLFTVASENSKYKHLMSGICGIFSNAFAASTEMIPSFLTMDVRSRAVRITDNFNAFNKYPQCVNDRERP